MKPIGHLSPNPWFVSLVHTAWKARPNSSSKSLDHFLEHGKKIYAEWPELWQYHVDSVALTSPLCWMSEKEVQELSIIPWQDITDSWIAQRSTTFSSNHFIGCSLQQDYHLIDWIALERLNRLNLVFLCPSNKNKKITPAFLSWLEPHVVSLYWDVNLYPLDGLLLSQLHEWMGRLSTQDLDSPPLHPSHHRELNWLFDLCGGSTLFGGYFFAIASRLPLR